ncbi:MAG: hypothetical protein NC394_08015 [Bacteroides sp.]|nr:hypothetical protein [Bacteroides sp.]
MTSKDEKFNYTYSAGEQEEIRRIREKYAPKEKEETTLDQLRRLDASAAKTASLVSMTLGVIGILILGVGMCCTMVWADALFILGIVIGIIGIAAVSAAYPLYKRMAKRKREKLAPEIMRLSEKLMK